jgi:hypothetical protein
MPARRQLIAVSAVLLAMSVAVAISFTAAAVVPAPATITASGVGAVKLGKTYRALRGAGLLGKLRPGCPLAGPNTRSAPLRPPLKGSVDLSQTSPRKVTDISVTGGAAARGIGIGATRAQVKAAFSKMKLDHSPESVFGITIARIPKGGGGPLEFAIDTKTKKVTLIALPFIAFCD